MINWTVLHFPNADQIYHPDFINLTKCFPIEFIMFVNPVKQKHFNYERTIEKKVKRRKKHFEIVVLL